MSTKTKIYQINIRQFISYHNKKNLVDLDISIFQEIKKDFDCVWLMGIWKLPPIEISLPYISEEQIKEYKKLKADFKTNDLCGSIFAIDSYKIDIEICPTEEEFKIFVSKLHDIGLKVILDFIPNHFHIESSIVKNNPEYFINWNNNENKELNEVFTHQNFPSTNIANGKDPHFPAWKDTAQLNWFNPKTIEFMKNQLSYISSLVDGVRCDMAMLLLIEIFNTNWFVFLNNFGFTFPNIEPWEYLISEVKKTKPDFILLAECYWNTQDILLKLGFNYVYNKDWYDLLTHNSSTDNMLNFIKKYPLDSRGQNIIFLENHDEKRAKTLFPNDDDYHFFLNVTKNSDFSYLENWGQKERFELNFPVQLKRIFTK
jgi:glycosidase